MMRTVKLRVVAILVIVMTLGIALAGSASAASPLDKLKDAQKRLEEIQDRLDEVSATCDRNEQRVADVNDRVKTTVQAVTEAEVAVGRQQRIVDEARQHLSELEAEASSVQDMSNGRVIELYKQGIADPTLSSLLASVSAEEVLSRAQVLNVVKHGDREALERLLSSQTAVDGQRKLYEEQQASFEQALAERERIVEKLEQLKKTYDKKVARCNKQVVKLEHQEQVAASDEQALASELAAQGVINVPPGVTRGGWGWPCRGTVTSPFGYRWGRLHAGIDVGAPLGAPMYAARGGVVSFAGVMGGYGNIIVIDHGDGMTTRYAHQTELMASVGQTVRVGDQIGTVGSTGNSTGPHAHFEVRINDEPQDPMAYLP
jgi:murein DD-endopeptidase MepM/ murein hydrolase activator NlpD